MEPYITPTLTMDCFICQMMLMQTSIGDWEHGGDFHTASDDDFDDFFLPDLDLT